MPRRSKRTGISAGQIIGLVAAVGFILLTSAVVLVLLFSFRPSSNDDDGKTTFRTSASSDLDLGDYLQNANALRGNAYRVRGRVEEQLKYSPSLGRLISLEAGGEGQTSPVPVLIPPRFGHVNIEKGANLQLVAEVGANGLLVAHDIQPD